MIPKIPLFFHIPKCSGTFVYASILSGARWFRIQNGFKGRVRGIETVRSIILMDGKYITARIIIFDQEHKLDVLGKKFKLDATSWGLPADEFSCSLLGGLIVLGIVIEPRGFRVADKILNMISCGEKGRYYKFIILRNTFERERSLYHYLMSSASIHEHTHRSIMGPAQVNGSFLDYIASSRLSDSWLIRNLLDLDNSTIISEEHFILACNKVSELQVYDIKMAGIAVDKMLKECYGVEGVKNEPRNKMSYSKIQIEDLPQDIQKIFNERTYWDQKLYQELTGKMAG